MIKILREMILRMGEGGTREEGVACNTAEEPGLVKIEESCEI